MTQEQDATNWQLLRQYKQLREEKATREAIAGGWGDMLVSIGQVLSSSGGSIVSLDLSKLPRETTMLETQRELKVLNNQVADLREKLRHVGMGDLL
jgi:hypothetical protein